DTPVPLCSVLYLSSSPVLLSSAKTKVYVGNLGTEAGKGELEWALGFYGPLRTVWIARNPPGFTFVEFEDSGDADDAVRGLDGKAILGSRVGVQLCSGTPRRSRFDRWTPAINKRYEAGDNGRSAYDCHRYSGRSWRSRSHNGSCETLEGCRPSFIRPKIPTTSRVTLLSGLSQCHHL
ncbi:serine/arginine-rich splicing factor 7, partial [Amphiprion ocellaris]